MAEFEKTSETIGKVTLDYSKYPGQDFYCDGEVEKEILKIAKDYSPVEYQGIIEERKQWPIFYHLSPQRENIVDFLPMDKSMKVLEVGSGCGAITGKLAEKAGQVTCIDLSRQRSLINAHRHSDCDNVTIHVGNFQDIEPTLAKDYDYVCLIGVFEYGISYIGGETPFTDFFNIVKKHVKPGGRLVIAIENKYGLKYWAGCKEDHLSTFFSGIEGYPDGGVVRTFSKKGLEKILKACGEKEYSFYYPYPDYKFMHTCFSDKRLPGKGELTDNLRNFDQDRMLLFDEKNAFDALIEDEMFPEFSNSFLLVVGPDLEVEYSRYSNDRTMETAIKTEILETATGKIVRKVPLSEYGYDHIRALGTYYEALQKRYEGSSLSVNTCHIIETENGPVAEFEYVEGVTLSSMLDAKIAANDMKGFQRLFQEYVKKIDYNSQEKVTDFDCIFSNILIQDDTWTIIDYEWTEFVQRETNEIAFRSLYCYVLENEKRNKWSLDWAIDMLGLKPGALEELQQQEAVFQKKVTGKHLSMAELRSLIGGTIFEPQKWISHFQENAGSKRVQIYKDLGNGFSEENSFFVEEAVPVGGKVSFTIQVDHGVKTLRIDPAMESCICKLESLIWNGNPISLDKRTISSNGRRASQSKEECPTFVFATEDPNIVCSLDGFPKEAENLLEVCFSIVGIPKEMGADIEQGLKGLLKW